MSKNFYKNYLSILTKNTMVVEVDSNLNLIFSNRQYLKIKNLEFEDVRFENIFDISFKYISEELRNKIQNVFDKKIEYECKINDKTKNGNPIFFELRISPLFADNEFKMFILNFQDITYEVNNEEIEKQRALFFGKVSHDLKSPINNIHSYLKLLEETNPTEEQMDFLNIIDSQSKLLLDLIQDIVDYSKISSKKKISLNLNYFDLKKELQPFLTSFDQIMQEKDIKYTIDMDSFDKKILIDKLRLIQILNNFISNALKFTLPNGNIIVSIKKIGEFNNNYKIRFSVKDNGIGMTEKQASVIFNEFEQASEDTIKKYGGTGLGLSISLYFVKLMGSKILLKTKENFGSEFYFDLIVKHD